MPHGHSLFVILSLGLSAINVKLLVVHAPVLPGKFFALPISIASLRFRHARDARAVMHIGIANPQRREKRSRHSRHVHNPQPYASDKRPIEWSLPSQTFPRLRYNYPVNVIFHAFHYNWDSTTFHVMLFVFTQMNILSTLKPVCNDHLYDKIYYL